MAPAGSVSGSWSGLFRLRASFDERSKADQDSYVELARSLGATAVPMCAREMRDPARRPWAIELLRAIADVAPDRVRVALREVAAGGADDAKLAALGLLAELGDEETVARFDDPARVHQQSLARFATQLDTAADVASAADLLVQRLSPDEIVQFVEAFAEASPDGARRLAEELGARVDLDVGARGELARVAAPLTLDVARTPAPRRPLGRPALLVGLRHHDGRTVIAVARRASGAGGEPPRWRALCVLCDAAGAVVEVLYRDHASLRAVRDDIVRPLENDGYARFAVTAAAARRLVGTAARRAVSLGKSLPSAYYLGRDLLGLTDGHVAGARASRPAALLGRAVDLLAAGELRRARPLLEHLTTVVPDDAEAASSLGLCLLGQGELALALRHLERAAWLEPAWPLHHWNVAAAAHRAGELARCAHALEAFLARADDPVASSIDPGHGRRVTLARRFIADHVRYRASRPSRSDHGDDDGATRS